MSHHDLAGKERQGQNEADFPPIKQAASVSSRFLGNAPNRLVSHQYPPDESGSQEEWLRKTMHLADKKDARLGGKWGWPRAVFAGAAEDPRE
jgi:hypothetical protein